MIDHDTIELIEKAVDTLKQGGIILAPTDTVWGLMCDFANEEAVSSIYSIKKSPLKPLAILVDSLEAIEKLDVEMTLPARMIAETYWPGPLTLIFKSAHDGIKHIAGENNSIGVRIPDYEELREMIKWFGQPIAATSANISGQGQPLTFEDIPDDITTSADLICRFSEEPSGNASTVVDCTGDVFKIIREGDITMDKLQQAVNKP
jgi:L-threonylcarbamoyladenylate synthase